MDPAWVGLLALLCLGLTIAFPVVACIVGMVLEEKLRIVAYEAETDRLERIERVAAERMGGKPVRDSIEESTRWNSCRLW